MLSTLSLCLLVAYVVLFIWQAYRNEQFQWLWGSVFLWIGFGTLGARLLPGILGITHLTTLYTPHVYIAIASVFYFANNWQRMPAPHIWYARCSSVFIGLFAVSGLLMLLSFCTLIGLTLLSYPNSLSAYILPALLQMYLFEPILWIGMQAILMVMFYVHRVVIEKRPANVFSNRQLQGAFLVTLLFQMVWVLASLLAIRY